MKHEDVTGAVIGCAFEVQGELGVGFIESVYRRSMAIAIRGRGFDVAVQQPLRVFFRGYCVGDFVADLIVDHRVLVELKAVRALAPEHHAQVINYLHATGIEVGLLINFGKPRVEYRRFCRRADLNRMSSEERGSAPDAATPGSRLSDAPDCTDGNSEKG